MSAYVIVGIGELLWDQLPGGKQLGGAPANFAYIAALLGDWGVIASRIGADALGDEIRKKLVSLGVDTFCASSRAAFAASRSWRTWTSARVARTACQVLTAAPATNSNMIVAAVVSAARCFLTNFRSR
jgi:hypothetical protein